MKVQKLSDKDYIEWTLKRAKEALQFCEEKELLWNQKQERACQALVNAVRETEKNRRNKIEMQREVERLEGELREVTYELEGMS